MRDKEKINEAISIISDAVRNCQFKTINGSTTDLLFTREFGLVPIHHTRPNFDPHSRPNTEPTGYFVHAVNQPVEFVNEKAMIEKELREIKGRRDSILAEGVNLQSRERLLNRRLEQIND